MKCLMTHDWNIQNKSGIVADGFERLRRSPWYRQKRVGIKTQVRAKYAHELAAATDYWQKVAIEQKIARETKQQVAALGSPYCLWFSPWFLRVGLDSI